MLALLKAKAKAVLLHGCVTLLVALLTAFLVYWVWYPQPFANLTGGTDLYLLVLGVEVVLGPIMSLVIFNPSKMRAELVRDYVVVGLIQLSALCYGLYSVYVSRPVYVVFVKDRLEVVAAAALDREDLQLATKSFADLPYLGPVTICVEYPTDPQERSDLLWSALEGKDIHLQPRYYRYCKDGEVTGHAYSRDQLESLTPIKLSSLPSGISDGDFSWLPVVSSFGSWIAVYVESADFKPVYVSADPFSGAK